jgi:hypothetical protein
MASCGGRVDRPRERQAHVVIAGVGFHRGPKPVPIEPERADPAIAQRLRQVFRELVHDVPIVACQVA